MVAHSDVKRKDRFSPSSETGYISFFEIPEPLSRIDAQTLTTELQFSHAPFPKRRIPQWIPVVVLTAAALVAGNALGHLMVAIGMIAVVILVAWGNWVIDNTAM